jgi:hypothetical protein
MPTHTKSLPGKLMDNENKELVSEGIVYLSLVVPIKSKRQPQCKGTMTVKGFTPQLYDKPYILHLDKFSGRVFLVTPPEIVRGNLLDRNLTQTPLKIMFEDNVWRSSEWFVFLRSLFGSY